MLIRAAGATYDRAVPDPAAVRPVLVVGGAGVDVVARPAPRADDDGVATSRPGTTRTAAGGVGRNVAEVLARLGSPTRLVTALGSDAHGDLVRRSCAQAGLDLRAVTVPAATASYVALLDADGELVGAVSDHAATDLLGPGDVPDPVGAAVLVLDTNLPAPVLAAVWDAAVAAGVPVVVDAVSVPKAHRLRPLLTPDRPLLLLAASAPELAVLGAPADLHGAGVAWVWERRGPAGSLLLGAGGPGAEHRLPAVDPARVGGLVDVTGAGDAMLAAWVHATRGGADPAAAARYAHAAAALTLAHAGAVRPDLTDDLVRSLL